MAVSPRYVFQADAETSEKLRRLLDLFGDKPPKDSADPTALAERRRFLQDSLGDADTGSWVYERVIGGNDLQPVNFLERGAMAARAVCKVSIIDAFGADAGSGTGFLVAPGVMITNNHVLPDRETARGSLARFSYERDISDREIGPITFGLDDAALFHTDKPLDFTVVAVKPTASDGTTPLSGFGYLPLVAQTGKVVEGEWLSIIQHPDGERKKICVRDNKLIKREGDVLWYTTDTLPGSSGSPVFNSDWFVVALHHAGVPEMRDGVKMTRDGRPFDARTMGDKDIKWIGNEGIRVSRIVAALREAQPNHPLLKSTFDAKPLETRRFAPLTALPATNRSIPASSLVPLSARPAMPTTQTLMVPVQVTVGADGQVSLAAPGIAAGARESTGGAALERTARSREPTFEAPFDPDYAKRKGFDPAFLGKGALEVHLPTIAPALESSVAKLLPPANGKDYVLHYDNYSVVMNAERRLAFFSAANVSYAGRFEMARSRDVWRMDPRIDRKHQLDGGYYANNQFDRGHLTRREDLEFGPSVQAALMSAGDTCHWTNCTPQHAKFNQNKAIWQGIERYLLEDSIKAGRFNAQIITGPVLNDGDPRYRKIQYPVQYWKVVAALKANGSLFATAYIASQAEVIAQYGIETTEAPFGAYKTFQTRISEIERLTGLAFTYGGGGRGARKPLAEVDPLTARPPSRRRGGPSARESTGGVAVPEGYVPIDDFDDIQA